MQSPMNPGKSGDRTPNIEKVNDHPEIPGCIRKMSRCERLFLMSPSCTVMIGARISGNVDESRFRQTLDAASWKHPLLRAKVVFDSQHEAWFSSEGVPTVPLRVIPRVSDGQWLDELKEEVRVPFDLNKGPLIKTVLLNSPEVSDLIIFCNHSICDGMALANLVRDLLCLYENPCLDVRVMDPPDVLEIVKPGISLKGLIARFFVGHGNRKWRKKPYYFGQEDFAALYRGYWEARTPGLVLIEFDPGESTRLLAACRDHGVTVGSAVSAACLAAHSDITGGFPKNRQTIMVPFDLRRRIQPPTGDVFCFYDGGVTFPFAYPVKKPFWANARDLHNKIHSRVKILDPSCLDIPEFEPSFIDALTAFGLFAGRVPDTCTRTETMQRFFRDTGNVVFSFNRNYEKNFPGFVQSNLGRIEVPESRSGIRLDRLIFVPAVCELNFILGGVGAGGRMVFSLPFVDSSAMTGICPESELIRIRNRALEYLGFPEKVSDKALE